MVMSSEEELDTSVPRWIFPDGSEIVMLSLGHHEPLEPKHFSSPGWVQPFVCRAL